MLDLISRHQLIFFAFEYLKVQSRIGKLRRLLSYLNETMSDTRMIGADSLESLNIWIDATYGVYNNMRSQTGGAYE